MVVFVFLVAALLSEPCIGGGGGCRGCCGEEEERLLGSCFLVVLLLVSTREKEGGHDFVIGGGLTALLLKHCRRSNVCVYRCMFGCVREREARRSLEGELRWGEGREGGQRGR